MDRYISIHTHSQFSLLDGIGSPTELAQRAKELNQPAVSISDHGVISGHRELQKACKELGIKPILGVEAYYAFDRFDRTPVKERDNNTDLYSHLIIVAKNQNGLKNLQKIVEESWRTVYKKPLIDFELLSEYSDDLIITTACMGGVVSKLISAERFNDAEAVLRQFKDKFGDDFYIELQTHNPPELNKKLIEYSESLDIECIISSDAHYISEDDKELEEVFLVLNTHPDKNPDATYDGSKKHKTIMDKLNYFYPDRKMTFQNIDLFLHTREQMATAMKKAGIYNERYLDNTLEIANKVGEYEFYEGLDLLPKPKNVDANELLRNLCMEGIKKRGMEGRQDVLDRIEYELEVIFEKDFSTYFLIVRDVLNWCRGNDIFVGPGRGSAAGSIVCYLLGITSIDPLEYDLLFDRFINRDRNGFPDIDSDIPDKDRGRVKEYIRKKWGEDKVAGISTYLTYKGNNAFRDAARALCVPYGDVDKFLKVPETFEECESYKEGQWFRTKYPEVVDLARKLRDRIKGTGVHAAGVVVANRPISDIAPMETRTDPDNKTSARVPVVAYNMGDVEDIGLIKYDFLGLITLSVINDCLKLVRERHGIKLNLLDVPLDNKKVFSQIASGHSKGVFQFDTPALGSLAKRIEVSSFDEMVACTALVRPGAMDAFGEVYISRSKGLSPIPKIHPIYDEITKNTYGKCLFQEQLMLVANRIGGMSWSQSDSLRKCLSGDSEILTKSGYRKIKDLQGKKNILAQSIDLDGYYTSFEEIDEVWSVGVKPVYQITTSSGRKIKATENHEFLVGDEWMSLSEISKGCHIGVIRENKSRPDRTLISEELSILCSLIISEGHFVKEHSAYFCNSEEEINALFLNSYEKVFGKGFAKSITEGPTGVKYFRFSTSEKKYLSKYIGFGKSRDKEVPKVIENSNMNVSAAFIGTYISCDGWVDNNGIHISSNSKSLLETIKRMLLKFRISSTVYAKSNKKYGDSFILSVCSKDDIEMFKNSKIYDFVSSRKRKSIDEINRSCSSISSYGIPIPMFVSELKRRSIKSGRSKRDLGVDYGISKDNKLIGFNRANSIVSEKMYDLKNGNVCWEEVVDIEYCGEEECFDFSMKNQLRPWAVANDIYVHNCIGKKLDVEQLRIYKDPFISGVSKEINEKFANDLWDELEKSANYLFNLSHSVAYSMLSYWTAWLKLNYPIEFMHSLLNNEKDKDKVTEYLIEAKRLGVDVKMPHVNKSDIGYSIEGQSIRFGLSSVKYISDAGANSIIKHRPYKSYQHLLEMRDRKYSGINSRAVSSLDSIGAAEFKDNPLKGNEASNYYEVLGIPNFYSEEIADVLDNVNLLEQFEERGVFIFYAMAKNIKMGKGWSRVDFVDSSGTAGFFHNENTQITPGKMYLLLIANNRIENFLELDDIRNDQPMVKFLKSQTPLNLPPATKAVVSFSSRKTKAGKWMGTVVYSNKDKELESALVFPTTFALALGKLKPGKAVSFSVKQTKDRDALFVDEIL